MPGFHRDDAMNRRCNDCEHLARQCICITDEDIAKCTNRLALFAAADRANTEGNTVLRLKLERRMDELKEA